MKKTLTLALASTLVLGSLYARTWTSSDGNKTFTGDYVSHTDTTVTVRKSGKLKTFKQSLLSEDDRKWISEQKPEEKPSEDAAASNDPGKIGKKLKGKLTKFDGKKYARTELAKTPEYYLVYFSASW